MRQLWNRIALALGFALCAALCATLIGHGTIASFHTGLHAAESFSQENSGRGTHRLLPPECDFCKASIQTRDTPELFDIAAHRPRDPGTQAVPNPASAPSSEDASWFPARAPPA